jgi:hypothetical protein
VTDPRRDMVDPVDDLPIDDVVEVQGDVPPDEQDGILAPDEIEERRRPTQTELDRGDASPDPALVGGEAELLDGLDLDDLREGETDDPDVAAEEGITYVPPIDPPVRADREDEEGVVIAAGAAVSAESEPYDEDHRSSDLPIESELTDLIRASLRADAATTELADRLIIGTRGGTVVIRGIVDGIEDTDAILEVVERVEGVDNVIDETELASG